EVDGPKTAGGGLFYRFPFELMAPYPYGRFVACLAAAFFVSAVISGVITHKRIFSDFFTFRPEKGGQRAWLDGHNVLGVLALPCPIRTPLTVTIRLAPPSMPAGARAGAGKDIPAYSTTITPVARPLPAPPAPPAPTAPLAPRIARAEERLCGKVLRQTVNNP